MKWKGANSSMQDKTLVDVHCHVLPEMDDGSEAVDVSLAILRQEKEQGVGAICATSHYYARQNSIPDFCARRSEAMGRLTAAIAESKEPLPQILPAAEAAYFPRMEEQDLSPLCIQGTRTLMLEMPFADWTDLQVEAVESLALDCGYRWCWCIPSGFASAAATAASSGGWPSCPSGCR